MQEFVFSIHEKIETWEENKVKVKANNKEEALNKIKSFIRKNEWTDIPDDNIVESTILYDAIHYLSIKDNKGYPTIIVYDEDDQPVYDNAVK